MADIELVLYVMGLFFVRIGLPVFFLIMLGTLIERWQTRKEATSTERS